ncbi:hypothetical protein [Maribacter aestuarii]|uniref:hypothetical protein n=1 Tax=Maribacter aestuarii TaxID=1130723 RepID=UPI00248B435F|nr:hypothetical protein [Maribacter aestuarii]
MNLDVRDKMPAKSRKPLQRNQQNLAKRMEIEASSLQNLFKKSLQGIALELKSEDCKTATHYDCTMHVSLYASDSKKLMVAFFIKGFGSDLYTSHNF